LIIFVQWRYPWVFARLNLGHWSEVRIERGGEEIQNGGWQDIPEILLVVHP
jgi:hypothetical protein